MLLFPLSKSDFLLSLCILVFYPSRVNQNLQRRFLIYSNHLSNLEWLSENMVITLLAPLVTISNSYPYTSNHLSLLHFYLVDLITFKCTIYLSIIYLSICLFIYPYSSDWNVLLFCFCFVSCFVPNKDTSGNIVRLQYILTVVRGILRIILLLIRKILSKSRTHFCSSLTFKSRWKPGLTRNPSAHFATEASPATLNIAGIVFVILQFLSL